MSDFVEGSAAFAAALRLPRITVATHRLRVTESLPAAGVSAQPAGGNGGITALRRIVQPLLSAGNCLRLCGSRSKAGPVVPLLDGVSVTFAAGTATLLLGAPGSGKSTLLRAVAGRLSKPHASGSIRFNERTEADLRGVYGLDLQRLAAFAPQDDLHHAFLTVEETLRFVHEACVAPASSAMSASGAVGAGSGGAAKVVPEAGPWIYGAPGGAASAGFAGMSEEQAAALLQQEQASRVDRLIAALHLEGCRGTIIGNPLVRGISGGQKRRVTLGAALLAAPRILAADQITDGLDSATAAGVVAMLVRWAHATGSTVVSALQAPTPETLAAFDQVVLMGEGRVLFSGPVSLLEPYLASAGFVQPSHVDTADFAVQVATCPITTLQLYADEEEGAGAVHTPAPASPPPLHQVPVPAGDQVGAVATPRASKPVATSVQGLADHWDEHGARWLAAAAKTAAETPAATAAAANHVEATEPMPRLGEAPLYPSLPSLTAAPGVLATPPAPIPASQRTVAGEGRYQEVPLPAPRVGDDDAASFMSFPGSLYSDLPDSAHATLPLHPLAAAQYGPRNPHSRRYQLRLLLQREGRLYSRNRALLSAKLIQSSLMAGIFGSIFWQLRPEDFALKISIAFFAAVYIAFSNMPEVPVTAASKRVVLRQLQARLYAPWAYVISLFAVQLPVLLLADLLFAGILYACTGMAGGASRFLFWYATLLAVDLTMSALFKLYAILAATQELAAVLASTITSLLLIYGGFLLPRQHLPAYGLPVFWVSPFSLALRSLTANEFSAPVYAAPSSADPSQTTGAAYAAVFGFALDAGWMAAGPCVLLSYYLLFGALGCSAAYACGKAAYPPGTRRLPPLQASVARFAPVPGFGAGGDDKDDKEEEVEEGRSVVGGETKTASATARAERQAAATAAAASAGEEHGDLHFTPVTLAFSGLTYSVPHPSGKGSLPLLRGVTGIARPGTLTALMGASGAGKTTLLDVLANRKTTGTVTGERRVNGHRLSPAELGRVSSYAEQMDVHVGTQTVREALEFSAELRLDPAISAPRRAAFVTRVLGLLDLDPLAGRLVSTLSPGEAKRLTLGVELAAGSSCLFADEPTTGLSAVAASSVMRALQKVAASGRTVIATIHQPSSAVFTQCSHLILLAPGGWQVFGGALGHHASHLARFLGAVPGVAPLHPKVNVASWALEQTVVMSRTQAACTPAGAAVVAVDSGSEANVLLSPAAAGFGGAGSRPQGSPRSETSTLAAALAAPQPSLWQLGWLARRMQSRPSSVSEEPLSRVPPSLRLAPLSSSKLGPERVPLLRSTPLRKVQRRVPALAPLQEGVAVTDAGPGSARSSSPSTSTTPSGEAPVLARAFAASRDKATLDAAVSAALSPVPGEAVPGAPVPSPTGSGLDDSDEVGRQGFVPSAGSGQLQPRVARGAFTVTVALQPYSAAATMAGPAAQSTRLLSRDGAAPTPTLAGAQRCGAAHSFARQLRALLRRGVVDIWRHPSILSVRLGVYLLLGAFFALTFPGVGHAVDQSSVFGKLGLLFACGSYAGISYFNTALPGLLAMRPVYYRERAAHMYAPEAYVIAATLRDLPFLLAFATLFSCITYFANGLAPAVVPFATFVLVIALLFTWYGSVALWLSAIVPNEAVAGVLTGAFINLSNLFAGVNVPPSQLPVWWQWLYAITGTAEAFRLNAMAQFGCEFTPCPEFPATDGGAQFTATTYSFVSYRFQITYETRWTAAASLLAICLAFWLLAMLGFRWLNFQKR